MANELVNMSDQFKGLPMGELIGGPLNAACEAQVKLAQATADFIKVIGFLPPAPDATDPYSGGTRTATFRFKRPVDNPAVRPGEPGSTMEEEVEICVPLLAIVKIRAAGVDALCMRSGIAVEKPAEGARDLMGHSLRELARECLVRAGLSAPGNQLEMVGRALTSSDLPNILGNVANRSLMVGFESQPETYELWVDTTGSLTDFKSSDLTRRGEVSSLQEVKEGGEFKYGVTSDTKEVVKLATYGEIIPITRQAIINDDLGALTDIPKDMGEAVSRLLGDLSYAVLTANSAMSDNVALFHTTHGNLAASGAAVDVTPLSVAEKAMGLQKDLLQKRRLNIKPQFFIGPLSIKGVVEQFFKTDKIGGVANKPNLANIYFGDYFTRIYDARLDDDSITAWYLAAAKGKTVKMFFLNGMKTPYMEQKTGWTVDGVELKVRMDAAAKAVDHRGLYKNPGA